MLDVLSNFVMQHRLKERLKAVKVQSKAIDKKFKSLLVICSDEEPFDEKLFLKFAKQFRITPSKVTLLVLSKKELVKNKMTTKRAYFFSRKSIGFFGKMPDFISELFQKDFDLQVNYFNYRSVFKELVSASCQSKLRVGFSKSNHQINDLILDIDPKQHKLFLKETKVYLNALLN